MGDVRANAALGAEALRQLILRLHGQVEVLQSVLDDKQGVRQNRKRRPADADQFTGRMLRA
jgi:hypothetical protein